jgi:uncharacterized protein (TIRG00374 family)
VISTVGILWFVAAIQLLVVGHLLRTIRWRIVLQNVGVEVSNLRPFTTMSLGYLINMLLPFRVGDLFRIGLLARWTRARFSTVMATVVIERLIDLFAVALLAVTAINLPTENHGYAQVFETPRELLLSAWSLTLGLFLLAAIYVVHRYAACRRAVWNVSSVFNDSVKSGILNFVYVVSDLVFVRPLLSSLRFWLMTVLMWLSYLLSLFCLASALDVGLTDLFGTIYFNALQVAPSISIGSQNLWFVGYLLVPLILILGYAVMAGLYTLEPLTSALHAVTDLRRLSRTPVVSRSQLFWLAEQYNAFLDRRFRAGGGILSEFEERGIDRVRLFRMFHGGSGAITALVEVDGELRVRKFATKDLGKRLRVQHYWLAQYNTKLPTVALLGDRTVGSDFTYDMAYVEGSRGFYEAIHTEPISWSIGILAQVTERMSNFHEDTRVADADAETITEFITTKVLQNFALLRAEFVDIFELASIEINGIRFELKTLDILTCPDWLADQLTDRRQAVIHGDLTIENIMIDQTREAGWFLIDPNPVNTFQSPFIDYAKLMQSLHLGYEALHEAPRAKLSGDRLRVSLHRSYQYSAIYDHYITELRDRFGEDGFKQILLHEWINYLRLIPYQLRGSREAGLAFFGCLCLLVAEFRFAYPEDFR